MHTPTPWNIIGKQGTAIWSNGTILAQMGGARTDHRQARYDAELIVRAVNSHAALVDALENIQLEARSRVPSIAVIAKLAMDALSLAKQVS